MVWDTTQSTLYTLSGAVERHNADFEPGFNGENTKIAAEPSRERSEGRSEDNAPAEREAPTERDEEDLLSELYEELTRSEPHPQPAPPEPPPAPIRARTERIAPCESCTDAPKEADHTPFPCEDCPRRCPKCGKPLPARKPSTLEALLADKDTLLLAALILLLWHEKADKKLIGALAFILFSG
ncbi:MAG: hypothetical protein K2G32_01850 [Oscillospiraceae bacterium]|nr:hypothetical protein [Oscillospiraceae bacterium]